MHFSTYHPLILETSDVEAFEPLASAYRRLLLDTLDVILKRFQQRPDYPYIDTKIDLFTGRNASRMVGDTDIFGHETVYSWIQSRGVEALCGHARWIESMPERDEPRMRERLAAIRDIVRPVIDKLEAIRSANGGSLFFWMDAEGRPFTLGGDRRKQILSLDPHVCYASDMFHVKAVAAAGEWLEDQDLRATARSYIMRWLQDVDAWRVQPDQQRFDPKNPVVPTPGQRSHSLRMITLGTLALYVRMFDDPVFVETGLTYIRYILDHHVNLDPLFSDLAPLDFVEFIDSAGQPFPVEGDAVCDPGHALEFVGLALKFMNVIRRRETLDSAQLAQLAEYDRLLPKIMLHVFEQGYNPAAEGICKLYSLNRQRALHADMPWWNLPEGFRAALLSCHATPDADVRCACREVARKLSNAFLGRYVTPQTYPMAWQTRDAAGQPIAAIPGTPDLDPGYHTGLSIIDALACLPLPT